MDNVCESTVALLENFRARENGALSGIGSGYSDNHRKGELDISGYGLGGIYGAYTGC